MKLYRDTVWQRFGIRGLVGAALTLAERGLQKPVQPAAGTDSIDADAVGGLLR